LPVLRHVITYNIAIEKFSLK